MIKIEANTQSDGTVSTAIHVEGKRKQIAEECVSIFMELPSTLQREDEELFRTMTALFRGAVDGLVIRQILEGEKAGKEVN